MEADDRVEDRGRGWLGGREGTPVVERAQEVAELRARVRRREDGRWSRRGSGISDERGANRRRWRLTWIIPDGWMPEKITLSKRPPVERDDDDGAELELAPATAAAAAVWSRRRGRHDGTAPGVQSADGLRASVLGKAMAEGC